MCCKRVGYFVFASVLLFRATIVIAEPAQLPVPAEKKNPIIREIKIEVSDIFTEPDLGWFYRGVNNLKISTKENVVRQELLFKEGDEYNEFLVEESERSLRRLPFLRKISITPVTDGDVVDVLVSVQDTWTLFPFVNLALGGGANRQTVGVAETNLLGFGKRLEVLYADDEGREKIEGVWDDRRLLGTFQRLTVGVFDRSDGYRAVGFYGEPFRSLVDSSAWSVDTDVYDLVGKLFKDGEESFLYTEKHEAFSAGYTVAFGEPESRVNRVTGGYDYSSSRFSQADEEDFDNVNVDPDSVSHDPSMLAKDRKFSGPFVALQSIEPDFVSMNYLDRFERVEDYNLGNEFYGRMTFAPEALGSIDNTLLLNVSDADGHRFSPTSFARGKVGLVSRVDADSVSNSILTADLRYYNVFGAKYIGRTYVGKYTFVGSFSADFADRLDKDKQLILGASSGLRGYEDRALTGDNQLLLNLEQRVHMVDDFYRLLSLGGAVFFDIGGASNEGWGDVFADELRSDIGIGLRIGVPRSSGGSVIRIDLAFPLRDAGDGTRTWEPRLLFTSGQVVNARLPNESQQDQASNVTVKFLP